MTTDPSGELLERLSDVARTVDSGSVHDTLQRIVELAVEIVPGCEHAGVTITHGKRATTPAASDSTALRFDAIQAEAGEGPCLDAIREHETFQTDDLAAEVRWPAFSKQASLETGVVSILAVRLFARDRTLGALDLLSRKPAAFDEESVAIAALFGAVAAVALNAAQAEEGLQIAVKSRDVIGRAKGILMERHKITDDEAFRRLSDASQRLNIRLVQIAERVAETGEELGGPPG